MARAVVDIGGRVSNRKGVSLPDTDIPITSMTPKDRVDLDAALIEGVDWVAISFVQRAEDVLEVKQVVGSRALVMAKIEKPQAIARLDEIIEVADALMVARGDLGVEVPLERCRLQKRITRAARRLGKPVVVATQMLESMILARLPTRAEVSDVATAVYEGADAVMLSAESAAGQYPIEAVATMSRIAEEVESDGVYRSIINAQRNAPPNPTAADAIAVAARDVAETLDSMAVCAWTASGATALRIARERPRPPILALTPNRDTARRLALVWGVHALETRTRATSRTWSTAPASTPTAKASRLRATASSSSRACPSARRARPIWSGSRLSAKKAAPESAQGPALAADDHSMISVGRPERLGWPSATRVKSFALVEGDGAPIVLIDVEPQPRRREAARRLDQRLRRAGAEAFWMHAELVEPMRGRIDGDEADERAAAALEVGAACARRRTSSWTI